MATKRPLVLNNGIIQQIQSGDTLIAANSTEAGLFSASGNLGQLAALTGTGIYARATGGTWTAREITGTADRITVTNGSGANGNPTLDIASTYAGQTSITTVGTIGTGTWQGTAVGTAYGGTGQTTYTDGQLLIGNTAGGLTKATLTAGTGVSVTNGNGAITIANTGVVTLASSGSTITVSSTGGTDYNVDLPNVGTAVTASFVKITTDAQGRVSATTAVVASDITALVDDTYVNVTGDTMSGALAMGNNKITGLGTPTDATDAATKGYVDSVAQGLIVKGSVRAATTANITLSNTQTIDGVVLVAGDRVLVKNQTTATENGIYVVVDGGSWVRAGDANTGAELLSAFTFVEEGTVYADTGWVQTANAPITIGTTNIAWTQFSGAGSYTAGNGLTLTGTVFAVGAGDGIQSDASSVTVKLDGSTLSKSASGLKVAQQAGLTVLGVTGTSTADVAAIAGTAGQVLRVNAAGSALAFGKITLSDTNTVDGTLAIGNGGTGQTTAIAAFDALAPVRSQGGLIVKGATTSEALAVGAVNTVLGVNAAGDNVEYKGIVAGNGITVAHTAGTITISSAATAESFVAAGAIDKLAPLYSTSTADDVAHALAAGSTSEVIGLALVSAADNAAVTVAVAGIVAGTTGEWDAVTGQTGGLTSGARYYLNPTTAGRLTTTAPTTDGQYVTFVGVAMSTTKMKLVLAPTIQL